MVDGVVGQGVGELEDGMGAAFQVFIPKASWYWTFAMVAILSCNFRLKDDLRSLYVHINSISRDRNRNGPVPRNQIIQVLRLAIAHALLHYHQYTLSDSRIASARRTLLFDFPIIAVSYREVLSDVSRDGTEVKAVKQKRAAE